MKFVLNKQYGTFSLSDAAQAMLQDGISYSEYSMRSDPDLINVVETLGDGASGRHALLSIVEIPDEATDHFIEAEDGFEMMAYVVSGKIYWA